LLMGYDAKHNSADNSDHHVDRRIADMAL
jgi:hypothetical protein